MDLIVIEIFLICFLIFIIGITIYILLESYRKYTDICTLYTRHYEVGQDIYSKTHDGLEVFDIVDIGLDEFVLRTKLPKKIAALLYLSIVISEYSETKELPKENVDNANVEILPIDKINRMEDSQETELMRELDNFYD